MIEKTLLTLLVLVIIGCFFIIGNAIYSSHVDMKEDQSLCRQDGYPEYICGRL